jgi:hypothetical protein
MIFLKFIEQNYFLLLYQNTLHNKFSYLSLYPLNNFFFTNISLYLRSHFLQNFNTIPNKRQKDEKMREKRQLFCIKIMDSEALLVPYTLG